MKILVVANFCEQENWKKCPSQMDRDFIAATADCRDKYKLHLRAYEQNYN